LAKKQKTMKRLQVLVFLLPISLLPASALAGELAYDAPEGCPGRRQVEERVTARAPYSRDAHVTIRRTGTTFVGGVTIGDGDETVERHVEGRTCDAVVDALVLVLSLDRVPARSDRADAPSDPPETTKNEPTPAAPAPLRALLLGPVAAEQPHEVVREAKPSTFDIAVGDLAEMRSLGGYVGVAGFGSAVFVELAPSIASAPWYRSSIRLSGRYLQGTDGPTTTFVGTGLDVCPVGTSLLSTQRFDLAVQACGRADAASAARRNDSVLYTDAGGVGHLTAQFGRRRGWRGFAQLDVGAVTRLGPSIPNQIPKETSDATEPTLMWMVGMGGGVVFP
jgi:hypothetical protein